MNRRSWAIMLSVVALVVGAALSVLGVFLPWMEMVHLSRSGLRGDGYLVLVGGGIGILSRHRTVSVHARRIAVDLDGPGCMLHP